MASHVDVVIIGGGASGLMAAATAGYRGKSVLVIEHSKKIGRKILMSGGGRCNFTNIHNGPHNFLSDNPHFCKSALSRYPASAFIELVERHGIEYHEKTLGQLFCNESSKEILSMLVTECEWAGVELVTETRVNNIAKTEQGFSLQLEGTRSGQLSCESLMIATGGLSIPNGGATDFAYQVAQQFGLRVGATQAALVPFTLQPAELDRLKPLAGVSHDITATIGKVSFKEAMLFTHRGLSGPAILQISSYWVPGGEVVIDFFPDLDLDAHLKEQRQNRPKAGVQTIMAELMSKRVAQILCEWWGFEGTLADLSNERIAQVANAFHQWRVKPSGTEGYRTAEVTLGGINTDDVSSKTMEAKNCQGLYFIGECLDVTGHLGGHNFQWAWASAVAAAMAC